MEISPKREFFRSCLPFGNPAPRLLPQSNAQIPGLELTDKYELEMFKNGEQRYNMRKESRSKREVSS